MRKDGTALTEVQAIAYWLARTHPRTKLWPQDIEAESRVIGATAYIVGTIHGKGFARIFATSSSARSLADHESVQELGRGIVSKGFSVLDEVLTGWDFVVGRFSVADPILFYVEFWADKTNIALPKNLATHYQGMLERPAVGRVLREEGYNPAKLGKSLEITIRSEKTTMAEMIVVEDRNQDDMSRKAGCYLYCDTRLWLENGVVHRGDGPAVIFPDGVERWYIRGHEMTRNVKTFFLQHNWPMQQGLDTAEKLALFQDHFVK